MLGPLKFYCRENNLSITQFPLSVSSIAELVELVESGQVSFNNASTRIMQLMIAEPGINALDSAATLNLLQESDSNAVDQWVMEVIAAMPDKVKEYKSGKKGLIGLFSGEVKKRSKGKADMQIVNKILAEKLSQ
jgi:aspartyl-tRNA(Asn)/glutamyl-tRNA(Gln) amidotransferase subunit B